MAKSVHISLGAGVIKNNFFLESLLSHIQILKTKHSYEVSINDFELPFLYYKTFQYYEAFLKFKELSQKCLEQKKYILYFICQYNIKICGKRHQSILKFLPHNKIRYCVKKLLCYIIRMEKEKNDYFFISNHVFIFLLQIYEIISKKYY